MSWRNSREPEIRTNGSSRPFSRPPSSAHHGPMGWVRGVAQGAPAAPRSTPSGGYCPAMGAIGTGSAVRQARLARLLSHGLLPGRVGPRDVHGVVRRMVAMQAQHPPAIPLAIRARCAQVAPGEAERARLDGLVVKTWGPRGTLHLMSAEDVAWKIGRA